MSKVKEAIEATKNDLPTLKMMVKLAHAIEILLSLTDDFKEFFPNKMKPNCKDCDDCKECGEHTAAELDELMGELDKLVSADISKQKSVMLAFDPKRKVATIDAKESDFDPKFLTYLLESIGLPKNTKVEFKVAKEKSNEN